MCIIRGKNNFDLFHLLFSRKWAKYVLFLKGITNTSLAVPGALTHRLLPQLLATSGPQNARWGLEIGPTLGYWVL